MRRSPASLQAYRSAASMADRERLPVGVAEHQLRPQVPCSFERRRQPLREPDAFGPRRLPRGFTRHRQARIPETRRLHPRKHDSNRAACSGRTTSDRATRARDWAQAAAAHRHRLGHALATGLRPRRARVPVRRSLESHCPDHRASRRQGDLGLGRPPIPATASRKSPKSGRP